MPDSLDYDNRDMHSIEAELRAVIEAKERRIEELEGILIALTKLIKTAQVKAKPKGSNS